MTDPAVHAGTDGRGRDTTAGIEGFFAVMWFLWGRSAAPTWLDVPLAIGAVAGVLVVIAGIVLAVRSREQFTLMDDPAVRQRFHLIVGAEFGLLGIGAVILGALGLADWIPIWICAGVGLHFLPLARIFVDRYLAPLGILILAVAAAALVVGLTTTVSPSTVTGPATGACLLLAGIITLRRRR